MRIIRESVGAVHIEVGLEKVEAHKSKALEGK